MICELSNLPGGQSLTPEYFTYQVFPSSLCSPGSFYWEKTMGMSEHDAAFERWCEQHRIFDPISLEDAYICIHCKGKCAPWEFICPECGCAQDGWEQERENTRLDR